MIGLRRLVGLAAILAPTAALVMGCGSKKDAPSTTGTATLIWSVNTESDLAGYKVYAGTASGTFGALTSVANPTVAALGLPISVGNATTYQAANLPIDRTYYFAVTAVDTSGNESEFSNETSKFVGLVDSGVPVRKGVTYYVAKTGSDNNSCSQATNQSSAKLTLNAGISCLSASDALIVKAGTYDEILDDPFANTGTSWAGKITVKAETPKSVIVKPTNAQDAMTFVASSQKYIEFDGIEIDAVNVSIYGVRIWGQAHHIRFKNSQILNAANQGVSILKAGGASPDFNEFINVEIAYTGMNMNGTTRFCLGSGDPVPRDGYCHGFYVGSDHNLFEGVNLHHNNGYGLQFYPQGNRGNTIRNSLSHDNLGTGIGSLGDGNRVINNVIYNNGGGGLLITESSCLVYNNTVYNNPNGFDGLTINGTGHNVKNNLFFQNDVDGMSLDATNLVGRDPQFIDAANGKFRPTAISAAIDAGISLPGVTTAIDGMRRPQGTAPDIGAYEFSTATGDIVAPVPPADLTVF